MTPNANAVLYIIATPIGNLEDLTLRAIRILGEADVLACEDTRQTAKIFNHYQIRKPGIRIPYHEHNEQQVEERLVGLLQQGKTVALCSDSGYPGISDPGYRIILRAIREQIPVQVIPGASAVPVALLVSGLPVAGYLFKGFAPKKQGRRVKFLAMEADGPHTLILYESPYRLGALLADALSALGNRRAAVCIELTKKFERVHRGLLEELVAEFDGKTVKGEVTVVIAGKDEKIKGKYAKGG